MELPTFAAGSFERVEEKFRRIQACNRLWMAMQVDGRPIPVTSMYAQGTTDHAEAVEMYFDPGQVSYEPLPNVFWDACDPASFNQKGSNMGSHCRSAIFLHSLEQKATARASKERLRHDGRFTRPIANGDSTCNAVLSCGRIPPASHHEAGRCGLSRMR